MRIKHVLGPVLMLLAGCVPSLNPIYFAENVVYDPQLLGVWQQRGSPEKWAFSRSGEQAYRLRYIDRDSRRGEFIAHLARVGDVMFLDLFPQGASDSSPGFHQIHSVPIHTIYLIRQKGRESVLTAFDYNWLTRYLQDHPNSLKHATYDGRILITASTAELQKFLVLHRDRFIHEIALEHVAGIGALN